MRMLRKSESRLKKLKLQDKKLNKMLDVNKKKSKRHSAWHRKSQLMLNEKDWSMSRPNVLARKQRLKRRENALKLKRKKDLLEKPLNGFKLKKIELNSNR